MENKSGIQWFVDAFKNFADFKTRSRRKAYWYFFLFNIIISYGLLGVIIGVGLESLSFLHTIYTLVALIPSLAVGVRRLHDAGKSGWFLLIPIYNLVLLCTDSEPGTNKWGPNPKNPELDMADHLVE
jgi:uncharacterized membrane protein YhaH (DUF805 family)